ncbi:acyl-CoA N-acyltransferase [Lentithecium fluviatile CBS 122367]|uniref:Acyl-CoA N-acyltransferase n=1 Tax=Lentithecium fluviatile CBS 122367 TaxID=1168545 RepID=A0A6G1IEN0_9PLEO|nr:acyl-CoA N-acyltransferase [Lentithecium fluviatile CBS 122367]
MPDANLVVSLLTPDEAPQYMRIRHAAFANDMNKVFYFNAPASEKTLNRVVEDIRDTIKKGTIYLKCIDTSTGQIIAGSRWTHHRPSDPTAKFRTAEEVEADLKIGQPYDESNTEVWNVFFGLLYDNKRQIMGLRPYYSLDTLVTHPDHHRRGAGGLLIKWGLEKADEAGLEAYLESSVTGRPLYERHGFEPVKEIALDLRKWGGEEEITWTLMKRPAKNAATT